MATSTLSTRLIPAVQYATPATGGTVTVNAGGFTRLFLNPAGTLATLTITFPGSPSDGDVVNFGSTQIVTALTMNGGTISGALSALAVGTTGSWAYSADSSIWIKI